MVTTIDRLARAEDRFDFPQAAEYSADADEKLGRLEDMDLNFAKELYYREVDGKALQDTRMGLYVALLSAVGGALAFLIRNAWPARTQLDLICLAFACLAGVLYFLAILSTLRAALGYTYERLPYADILLVHWRELSRYHESNPEAGGSAREDFEDFLIRRFISAAGRNGRNNLIRSTRFYRAAQVLLWVVICSAVAGACLALSKYSATRS